MMSKDSPYIFIRGLSRCSYHWKGFVTQFANANNVTAYTIDLPGFGDFCNDPAPLSINKNAKFIKLKIQELGYTLSSVNLVAISLGGMVGLSLAQDNKLNSLTIINSSHGKLSSLFERIQPNAIISIVNALAMSNVKKRESLIFNITCNKKDNKLNTVANWVEIQNKYPARRYKVLRQLYAASRFKKLDSLLLNKPLKVISSKEDQLVSYLSSVKLAKHYSGELVLHEYAGHDIPNDDPDWLTQKIIF